MVSGRNYHPQGGGLTGAGSGKETTGRAEAVPEGSVSCSRDDTKTGGGSRKLRSRMKERRRLVLVFNRPDSGSRGESSSGV